MPSSWTSLTSPMPEELNHTHIVLIPKVRKPVEMKDLRPISLCNVSYKLISKIFANRLKKLLLTIIKENQSAFVLGRLNYYGQNSIII